MNPWTWQRHARTFAIACTIAVISVPIIGALQSLGYETAAVVLWCAVLATIVGFIAVASMQYKRSRRSIEP